MAGCLEIPPMGGRCSFFASVLYPNSPLLNASSGEELQALSHRLDTAKSSDSSERVEENGLFLSPAERVNFLSNDLLSDVSSIRSRVTLRKLATSHRSDSSSCPERRTDKNLRTYQLSIRLSDESSSPMRQQAGHGSFTKGAFAGKDCVASRPQTVCPRTKIVHQKDLRMEKNIEQFLSINHPMSSIVAHYFFVLPAKIQSVQLLSSNAFWLDRRRVIEFRLKISITLETPICFFEELLDDRETKRLRRLRSFTVACKECSQDLATLKQSEILPLPSDLWASMAEAMVCEECPPLRLAHDKFVALPNRVCIGSTYIVMNAQDVYKNAVLHYSKFVACARCKLTVGFDKSEKKYATAPLHTHSRLLEGFEECPVSASSPNEGFHSMNSNCVCTLSTTVSANTNWSGSFSAAAKTRCSNMPSATKNSSCSDTSASSCCASNITSEEPQENYATDAHSAPNSSRCCGNNSKCCAANSRSYCAVCVTDLREDESTSDREICFFKQRIRVFSPAAHNASQACDKNYRNRNSYFKHEWMTDSAGGGDSAVVDEKKSADCEQSGDQQPSCSEKNDKPIHEHTLSENSHQNVSKQTESACSVLDDTNELPSYLSHSENSGLANSSYKVNSECASLHFKILDASPEETFSVAVNSGDTADQQPDFPVLQYAREQLSFKSHVISSPKHSADGSAASPSESKHVPKYESSTILSPCTDDKAGILSDVFWRYTEASGVAAKLERLCREQQAYKFLLERDDSESSSTSAATDFTGCSSRAVTGVSRFASGALFVPLAESAANTTTLVTTAAFPDAVATATAAIDAATMAAGKHVAVASAKCSSCLANAASAAGAADFHLKQQREQQEETQPSGRRAAVATANMSRQQQHKPNNVRAPRAVQCIGVQVILRELCAVILNPISFPENSGFEENIYATEIHHQAERSLRAMKVLYRLYYYRAERAVELSEGDAEFLRKSYRMVLSPRAFNEVLHDLEKFSTLYEIPPEPATFSGSEELSGSYVFSKKCSSSSSKLSTMYPFPSSSLNPTKSSLPANVLSSSFYLPEKWLVGLLPLPPASSLGDS